MIRKERCIVMDVDGTLCPIRRPEQSYADLQPYAEVVDQLKKYRDLGFYIILYSARNMKTYDGNIGQIIANTGKEMMEWLGKCGIPYDEIHLGKPWPGKGGFYVDDKTVRPDEFVNLSYDEILELVGEKPGGE